MENNRTKTIADLLRNNIRNITPYSSARSEFTGIADIFLDANENYQEFLDDQENPRNRYPDPFQRELKEKIARIFDINPNMLFLGNGSDEAIDLLYRAFAEPGKDKAVIMPPTYGVYKVFADLNDVETVSVPLTSDYAIDMDAIEQLQDENNSEYVKLLFICSPNNPTGNAIALEDIRKVVESFPGIVVVDEAYQDFSDTESALSLLENSERYPNLVVLRTFSKAWGLANVRMGCAIASSEITEVLKNIKYPYNLSGPAQETAVKALRNRPAVREGIARIKAYREALAGQLETIKYVEKVYPSDANFILVKVSDATRLYTELKQRGIIIRNRTTQPGCENCVRITVGSQAENEGLLKAMKRLEEIL